jgi:hypothetical protein
MALDALFWGSEPACGSDGPRELLKEESLIRLFAEGDEDDEDYDFFDEDEEEDYEDTEEEEESEKSDEDDFQDEDEDDDLLNDGETDS